METSTILCKVCKELKIRVQDGTFDGKNKRWRNESGQLFNGKICPTCELTRVKNKMKEKRGKDNEQKIGTNSSS